MKNKEKYSKEIVEIACKGHGFRVDKNTNEVADCCDAPCTACLFSKMEDCDKARRKWAESEYIEKSVIVISKRDRVFLEYLSVNIQYMARDMSGRLYIYTRKPYKQVDCWSSSACETEKALWMFNIEFPMVKWSDSKPWLIEDLKKLEVVDSYE
nr:MAG TPA: hypothetical protein [Caudoviricetes sp.]